MRGSTLVEFAIAWPVALLCILGAVQLAVWGSEVNAARTASLAGAQAGSVAPASASSAADVALQVLRPNLVGATAAAWCPGQNSTPPVVWVCAADLGGAIQVDVGGRVPALVPMVPGGSLPLHAHVVIQKELFTQ